MSRYEQNTFPNPASILPGIKPVMELLSTDPQRIVKIYCKKNRHDFEFISKLCRKKGITVETADKDTLNKLCGMNADTRASMAHQGIVAILTGARLSSLEDVLSLTLASPLPVAIAMDQVQDTGNLGAICRTAYALGAGGIILPRHNSASPGPAVAKTSAGALEKIPFAIVSNLARSLDTAEQAGFIIYGTGNPINAPGAEASVLDAFHCAIHFPALFVLGNENRGMRPGVAKRCAHFINIPFARNFDSLNVAQAGAILLGLAAAQNCRQSGRL